MAMNAAFFDVVRSSLSDGKLTQHQVNVCLGDLWGGSFLVSDGALPHPDLINHR